MELRYFKLEEFDSPDYPGSGEKFMDWEFLDCLDEARDIAGIKLTLVTEHLNTIGRLVVYLHQVI